MIFVNLTLDPFLDRQQNLLSLFCLVQLATTLFMGLLIVVNTVDNQSNTSTVVFNILVFLQAVVIFVPVLEVNHFSFPFLICFLSLKSTEKRPPTSEHLWKPPQCADVPVVVQAPLAMSRNEPMTPVHQLLEPKACIHFVSC